MDMTADDAMDVLLARHLNDRLLVVGDILDRLFGLILQIGGDRPITKAHAAAKTVEVEVKVENPIIEPCANPIEEFVEVHHAIELMSMQNEIGFAVSGGVQDFAGHDNAAEIHIDELLEAFVMVAGNVDYLSFLAAFAEKFLDKDVVVILPMPLGAQGPTVNKIADQIEVAAIDASEEFEEGVHLGVLGAEMDVRDPD